MMLTTSILTPSLGARQEIEPVGGQAGRQNRQRVGDRQAGIGGLQSRDSVIAQRDRMLVLHRCPPMSKSSEFTW
jgi:hypothetical protein